MVSGSPTSNAPLLEVEGLSKSFAASRLFGSGRTINAVRDVSFRLGRGEAIAVVGESGSGKSTVARLLLRLEKPDAGSIRLDGRDVLAAERGSASLAYRRRVQMVFQDPFGSLNPVHSVLHHLERPLLRHHRATRADVRARAEALLDTVGLRPAGDFLLRFPHELSGGQRQRVAIARALAVQPDVLVADEPTSMLDVSIRVGILNLLAQLKRDHGLGIVLITHDLASARYLADRVLVCHRGRVVEDGPTDAVVEHPAHPYTRALIASIAGFDRSAEPALRAASVGAAAPTVGCAFATRCPDVLERCRTEDPAPRRAGAAQVRCHLHPEVTATPAPGTTGANAGGPVA